MGITVNRYDKSGYKPLVDYGAWRVAILNHEGRKRTGYIERHLETDEVFVLLTGQATLFDGGTAAAPNRSLRAIAMKKGSVYNVKKASWHYSKLSASTKILIVENRNTTGKNSEKADLTDKQKKEILRLS